MNHYLRLGTFLAVFASGSAFADFSADELLAQYETKTNQAPSKPIPFDPCSGQAKPSDPAYSLCLKRSALENYLTTIKSNTASSVLVNEMKNIKKWIETEVPSEAISNLSSYVDKKYTTTPPPSTSGN